jgi:hypothetical protein
VAEAAEREIRALMENWVVWRDPGQWERFRSVWHDGGVMMATWFQGTSDAFIEMNVEGWKQGVRILHFLGGSSIDVTANRAVAQTKMTISQRAIVDGVECDVVCTERFYDFFECRDGRWGYAVKPDMPGLDGPEVEALCRDGAIWLAREGIEHRLTPWAR